MGCDVRANAGSQQLRVRFKTLSHPCGGLDDQRKLAQEASTFNGIAETRGELHAVPRAQLLNSRPCRHPGPEAGVCSCQNPLLGRPSPGRAQAINQRPRGSALARSMGRHLYGKPSGVLLLEGYFPSLLSMPRPGDVYCCRRRSRLVSRAGWKPWLGCDFAHIARRGARPPKSCISGMTGR